MVSGTKYLQKMHHTYWEPFGGRLFWSYLVVRGACPFVSSCFPFILKKQLIIYTILYKQLLLKPIFPVQLIFLELSVKVHPS